MRHHNRELWVAFFTILLITLVYLWTVGQVGAIPAASGLFGHGLGILGFILMLMTEILYTWRKRSRSARWGRMSSWLRFHIFTGLVGPYMVLLHSSWKFNGLAGIVMLLTVLIVLSGIVGRYIYTAIPRTAEGAEIESLELAEQIVSIESSLEAWRQAQPQMVRLLSNALREDAAAGALPLPLIGEALASFRYRRNFRRTQRKLDARHRAKAGELAQLIRRKQVLQRQVSSLVVSRRLLSLWHTVHIPIGLALFSTAVVHILGAIYYATLLR
jgi:hypothetical protein